ncbi:MAG: hypothetical protein ACUVYA_17610 [Planctomycetota bacterium]
MQTAGFAAPVLAASLAAAVFTPSCRGDPLGSIVLLDCGIMAGRCGLSRRMRGAR